MFGNIANGSFAKLSQVALINADFRMISLSQSRGVSVVLISAPRLGLGLEVPELYGELTKEFAIPLEGKTLK